MHNLKMNYITSKELKEMLDQQNELLMVDVREDYEYEIVHIDGCKHIPLDDVLDNAKELQKAPQLVFYCNTGKKSAAIAHTFIQKYKHPAVYSLIGGIQAYINEE